MSNQLVRYEQAVRALAACKAVDEVKSWADKAAAMQAYGRMAKDKTMEVDAAEIRIRAERRLGEMIAAQKAATGLAKPGPKSLVTHEGSPKLADAGISYDLSSRAQKLAAVPEAEFEAEVGQWRDRVSAEGKRVSARLEKSGERHLRDQEPQPYNAEDGAPSLEELLEADKVIEQEQEAMRRMLEADDKLAEALAMIKQRDALVEQLSWRINALTNENAELIRSVKYWRRQAEKAAA